MKIFKDPARILFIPTAIAMIMDFFVTLIGQPAGFWGNSAAMANEGSPIGRMLLTLHNPFFFIVASILYLVLVYFIFACSRLPFNFMICFGFLVGHFYGASTWISYETQNFFSKMGFSFDVSSSYSWWFTVFYAVFFGIITGFCLHKYIKSQD